MPIPQSFIDELVERCDIADVVGDYVELKKKGVNMFGLCPFHSEKTPSFSVNRDRQIFHCFGCGVGGGVITFIMKIENLDFVDAVKVLAARVGMTVPEDGDPSASALRKKILEINKLAARRFHENLIGPDGAPGMDYFRRRGLTMRTIKRFGLGWAPDRWDDLIQNLGCDKQDLYDAGLVVKNQRGGFYDRFRGRVIFPIIDLRGEVVAFGGRVLDDSLPKYINSPESVAYTKGRNVFALNLAKKSQRNEIILAEGYMDVITLHQAGFDSAVAAQGTALTEQQVRLISRYKKDVVVALDMDGAGRNAVDKAIKLFGDVGVKVRMVDMAGAKDPDEFIKKFGADALSVRLERSEGHMEYRLGVLRTQYDLQTPEGRLDFVKAAAPVLADIESPAEREVYTARAAEMSGISSEAVAQEVTLARNRKVKKERSGERRKALNPLAEAVPKSRELSYSNPRSALAEEGVLRCVYSDGELLRKASERLKPEQFSSPALAKAYSALVDALHDGRPPGAAVLEGCLDEAESSLVGAVLMKPEPGGAAALDGYIAVVEEEYGRKSAPDDLMSVWQRRKQKETEDKENEQQ